MLVDTPTQDADRERRIAEISKHGRELTRAERLREEQLLARQRLPQREVTDSRMQEIAAARQN